MKLADAKKIIRKAKKESALYLSDLDAVLKEDKTFEKNLETMVKSLGELPVKENDPNLEEAASKTRKKRRTSSISQKSDQFFLYLREINRLPRMSREEESKYSKRLEFFKARLIHTIQSKAISKEIKNMLLRFNECPGSPMEHDIAPLCRKLGKCPRGKVGHIRDCCLNYNSIRARFVERNLHLVVNLAKQYRTYGIPLMDLVQEGNTALIRAVEKYDWRKGVRFQTYATFWIKQAIERCITASKGIVRVPNYLQQKMRRFQRNGVLPSDKTNISVREVSEAFELSSEVAGHLLETGRGYVSLDTPQSDDEKNTLSEMLTFDEEDTISDSEFMKLKGRLMEALTVLSDQERYIISHRFGLGGKEIKTLDEIGKMMNVSRERIRQLQIRALQKLKKPSLLERLAPFLS